MYVVVGSAGNASHGVATMIPGAALRAAQGNATGLAADMARTRMALDERGEKLGRLDERWCNPYLYHMFDMYRISRARYT